MKKNYILLSALVLTASMTFGQNARSIKSNHGTPKLNDEALITKAKKVTQKAFLDTLFYEDFAGGIPAGWVAANNSGNQNNWIWSDQAPGGNFSTNQGVLTSTTGANGYMVMPADLYNSPIPTPIGVMDATISSPMISPPTGSTVFPASVLLRWQHALRYCCSSASSEVVVEVSSDGINYVIFDASDGKGINTASGNGDEIEINVSSVLAGASAAYIRYRMTGNTHYYWLVDDVTLLEGPANSLIMDQMLLSYNDTFAYVPSYGYEPPFYDVPQFFSTPMFFYGESRNYGSNTLTGAKVSYEVIHDSTYTGGAGTGLGYVTSGDATSSSSLMPDSSYAAWITPGFISTIDGYFRVNVFASSDSLNQNSGDPMPPTLLSYDFRLTDSIMGATAGSYLGDAGPGNYVGGGADGDMWANLFTMGPDSALATSISYFVYTGTAVEGSQIQPVVYEWNGDTATAFLNSFGNRVAGSPFTVTIDTNMQGTWLNIPLFPPVKLAGNRKYLAGWEQVGGASTSKEFSVFRNRDREHYYDPVSPAGFMYITADSRWYTSPQLGGIRLNFGQLTTSLEKEIDEKVAFAVMPNPTTGELKVVLESNVAKTYRMNVRNMIGQTVYTDNVSVNGKQSINLNLAGNDKGVYFVTLENGNERLVKKVVLK